MRSYYHGTVTREEAVARLEKENRDGTFLLRMSSTQDKAYTLSVQFERRDAAISAVFLRTPVVLL